MGSLLSEKGKHCERNVRTKDHIVLDVSLGSHSMCMAPIDLLSAMLLCSPKFNTGFNQSKPSSRRTLSQTVLATC